MNVHKKIIINSKDSIRKKQNAWAWLDEGTDIILLYVNTTQQQYEVVLQTNTTLLGLYV